MPLPPRQLHRSAPPLAPGTTIRDEAALLDGDPAELPRRVMIVRHGTSTYNATKRVAGWIDAPLSPEGWEMARTLRGVLADTPVDVVYASTLRRAAETAAATAAARGLIVRRHPALREQCLGILEDRFRDERDPDAAALWALRAEDRAGVSIPGAESFGTLAERVRSGIAEIVAMHPGESVLIVGHRVANRAMVGALIGLPVSVSANLRLRSRAVYEITPGTSAQVREISLRPESLGASRPWRDHP